ncbi:hypothetical protein [Actinomadura napierensis]|uniref:hypothetical protein n=1 Tax=Actinomadura napierensis TaxID=267854 RepID=UPI0031DFD5D2
MADSALAGIEASLVSEDYTDPRQRAMVNNLERRQRESEFLQLLAARGFQGTMWDTLADELAAYGIPVLMSMIRTHKVSKLCADKGRPIPPLPSDWTFEDRSDLTALTVAKAIKVFRERVLAKGRWDSERGATLKTFFIGAVIQQFPNLFNGWCRERRRLLAVPGLLPLEEMPSVLQRAADQPCADPARTVAGRQHLLQVLTDMPADLRIASLLLLEGHPVKEAAAAIGKSGDALSEQMRRYRNGRGSRLR